jgi:hypothetical protein
LVAKAAAELLDRGERAEAANRQLQEVWDLTPGLLISATSSITLTCIWRRSL